MYLLKTTSENLWARILCLCLSLMVVTVVNGQTINRSVYSYFGFGNLQGRTSALNRAMGFTGIAVRDNYNISAMNPAAYNSMVRPFTMAFEFGANYESVNHETNTSSSSARAGGINGLNLLFRPTPKWGIIGGASALSSMTYKATSALTFGNLNPIPVNFEGSGGINQFYLGNSYELFKNFSLGANIIYFLGTVKKQETVAATAVSDQLLVTNRSSAHNVGYDAGLQYTIPIKKSRLVIGATFDPGAHLDGTQQIYITNPNLDTLKKTNKIPTSYRLPPTYGGGLSYVANRSTFAADVVYMDWNSANVRDYQTYQNSTKYSFGYEYRGDLTAVKYLSAISLRAGGFVQNYPLVLRGDPFNTWGYNIGISLPLDNYRASINVNYTYIELGTTNNGLVKERSSRLQLDFIVRDIWGIKRKVD